MGATCDALITDPPYSQKTHSGHNTGTGQANRVREADEQKNRWRTIGYSHWTAEDVGRFVESWSPRTRGWFVAMTDHVLAPHWIEAFERAGRYTFSPIAYLATGSRVRLMGDGPSQWSVWIVASRPKAPDFVRWGALPGGYVHPTGEPRKPVVIGGKPDWIMRALVRDYSRAGDVVCDPCAGAATTLRAAISLGRSAIGAEIDPQTYALGRKLLTA